MKNSTDQDLLNSGIMGSYISHSANDLLGITANSSVSFQKNMDSDSLYYLQYQSGAKRELLDSVNSDEKYYRSLISLKLTKKINDSTTVDDLDTMEINYKWTPSVFEISKIYYNHQLIFEKQPSQPNVVTIIK